MKTTRRQRIAYAAAHVAFMAFALVFFCWALPALITYAIGAPS